MIGKPLLALGVLSLVLCSQNAGAAEATGKKVTLEGTYKVVAIRNASDVAAPAAPLTATDSPVGKDIKITADSLEMGSRKCAYREGMRTLVSVINRKDPILADIDVPPADSPLSRGDQRIMTAFHYKCSGKGFVHVYKVDDRVIVIPWDNSARYLIAEKPLSSQQIIRLQKALKDVKFLEAEPSGKLDAETLRALSNWSHYRLGKPDAYKFGRVAITENLLDTMGVLD